MNRRNFLETSSAILAGTVFADHLSIYDHILDKNKGVGLQLYTLRNEMKTDTLGTLKKVSEIGYAFIENAGYNNGTFYQKSKADLKKLIDELGLKMVSGHIGVGDGDNEKVMGLKYKFEKVCEDAVFVGQKYIGTGSIEQKYRTTIDDYKRFAEFLNKGAEIAKQHDLIFFHHNHDFEFVKMDGIVPYDLLLKETDKDLVKFELDHYWTRKAAVDSIRLMEQHPGRFSLWHIKDMDNTDKKAFTEVGTGVIDYQEIFKHREVSGMAYYFIEQDNCITYPPLKSVEISFNNLKKLKI